MFLHSIYSGQLFFAVAGLFVTIVLLDLSRFFDERPRVKRVAGIAALLTIPLAIIGGPPLPIAVALAGLTVTSLYVARGFGQPSRRLALGGAAIVACVVAVAVEAPYHFVRSDVPKPAALFVIGDSLSSGGFGEHTPWPQLLGRDADLPVTNLALASGDVAMALERQVPQLPPARQGAGVLVAIGGNDMLDGTDLTLFETTLDRIVAAAGGVARQRTVVVLEMPVLPGRWAYGSAQRRIARKHGCVLVPKRIVVQALLGRGNTSDGLHLTQQGHEALARMLNDWLEWN